MESNSEVNLKVDSISQENRKLIEKIINLKEQLKILKAKKVYLTTC